MDGEKWRRMRSQLDKQMMRPKQVANYTDDFNAVSEDFIKRLRQVRRKDDNSVRHMDQELFNWSLESRCHPLSKHDIYYPVPFHHSA